MPAAANDPVRRFQIETYWNDGGSRHGQTYRIVYEPSSGNNSTLDLTTDAMPLRAALAQRGWLEAPAGSVPDLQITVSFRIDERVETNSPRLRRFRPVTHRVRSLETQFVDATGKTQTARQRIAIPTDDGYVASQTPRRIVTTFVKQMTIAARTTTTGSPRELWRVQVTNKDEQGDSAGYAALMITAAADSLGDTFTGRREIVMANATARTPRKIGTD